jgi:signal transduction histidine kinase
MGWRLVVVDERGQRLESTAASVEPGLRASLPLAVLALLAALFSLLAVSTNRPLVLPLAWLACISAATPLVLQGAPGFSTAAAGAAAALPAAWAASRIRSRPLRAVVALGFVAGLGAWALARLGGWASYEPLDAYRSSFALVGGVALVADQVFLQRASGEGFRVIRPDIAEIVTVGLLAAIAVGMMTILQAPPIVVALLVVIGAFALPSVRRRVRPVENALLGGVRAQAAADGAEAERARLARELHDVPLQELIGAIRQLEIVPGTEQVSDDLRALAGHLRNVAIDLRPPVLDDLGLPAALQELAEETSRDGLPVEARLVDTTSFDREARPPEDIELAMYRIAAEAVSNSVRHSGASRILIQGEIGRDRVDLTVADDGRGLSEGEPTRTGKHIGLSAMRRRAQAVDADLSVRSSSAGTEVHAEWHH